MGTKGTKPRGAAKSRRVCMLCLLAIVAQAGSCGAAEIETGTYGIVGDLLVRFDADNNSKLDLREREALAKHVGERYGRRGTRILAETLAAADTDGDRQITKAEWAALGKKIRGRKPSPAPRKAHMVPMRDGVRLATDVYLPEGPGPFPVVLMRTVYNKDRLTPGRNHPYLRAGVAFVAQDCRGRFASEGKDGVFRTDNADGHDTLKWILAQSWCNGRIATQGGSALGIVQYMAAPGAPAGLRSMVAVHATPNLYDHALFPGGVFRRALAAGWLKGQGSAWFLDIIAKHPRRDDEFWDPARMIDRAREVNVPAVHIGGWFDIFAQGTIDAFVAYRSAGGRDARNRQHLIMGPWPHSGRTSYRVRGQKRPFAFPNARPPWWVGDTAWALHHLGVKRIDDQIAAMPAVQYYVMGDVDDPKAPGNQWRKADHWPVPATPLRLYLHPGGSLSRAMPPEDGGRTGYRYDPADPCPTVGGANMNIPAGPQDQRTVEARSDVIAFQTPALTKPMEITGRVTARLYVSADAVDTDVMVRMTDVYPDGRSMLMLDAPARLARKRPYTPGAVVPVDVDLWSTSLILNTGHRLRISVTSSNYPRFRANPNDGTIFGESRKPVAANVRIRHAKAYPSHIEVPIPEPRTDSKGTP